MMLRKDGMKEGRTDGRADGSVIISLRNLVGDGIKNNILICCKYH
jgi:hypothetical protein